MRTPPMVLRDRRTGLKNVRSGLVVAGLAALALVAAACAGDGTTGGGATGGLDAAQLGLGVLTATLALGVALLSWRAARRRA